jgi:hypothetical protein
MIPRRAAVFVTAAALAAFNCGKGDSSMQLSEDPAGNLLRSQILARNGTDARQTANRMGPAAGEILRELAGHNQTSVRQLVLELAAENPSAGSSRAILSRLSDGSATIRSIAGSLIGLCTQKEIVEDLFQTLDLNLDPSVTSAVVLQIGIAGERTHLPRLSKYRDRQSDPEIVHDCGLAMARLGDLGEHRRVIEQLSDADLNVRVRALRDTHYLADRHLAMHFLPALEDRREATMISGPHEVPPRYARVCDIAIQAMAVLGWELSFSGRVLERHDERRIAEAIALVRTIR